ncbi:aspartate kinase [Diplocloster agilis]|uniref:Aspartokinase n=1 Tax=Diplocloster agilis TaxID=2850323 RepID=A0A949K0U0_9FIRM|nr:MULTISPECIES: aspartate kinase [Lachnospiraceae]MBU9737816.1 aspartate kinase [Diplocloster agilis]MBU9745706.1 aspartate kinase [Diplocloster agilis]MCU6735243.1 aspartate kinase [Suonthocola fibrivorans]SCJ68269.1 Aspartokinase 2 [uncultured Clostridium sp.]
MLIVKKFGGSSVADKERIMNVAKRCIEDYKRGHDIVVVLSAMGKTTDQLLAKAYDINPLASKRELDMLLTTGEQTSVALMAMAMDYLGVPAVSLNAFQVAMHTTSKYGNSRLKRIDSERIRHELDSRKIVIITGFQGVNKYDDLTTLGRGGSDTTAVALAAALRADACEIYTDVEGVYTADPRVVPNARKLKEITYDEMLEMATLGAKVLHNRSVEMAKKYGVPLVVRSSLNTAEGTVVKEEVKVEGMLLSGVAADKNTARISVIGLKDEPGIAFKLFNVLARKNINVDIILQSVGRDGTKDISFTVDRTDLREALDTLEENKSRITAQKITFEDNVAKVSVIGAGMMSNPGVAAKMFEALYNAGVNIKMISTSEIRVTVLINESEAEKAMVAVHDYFGLED